VHRARAYGLLVGSNAAIPGLASTASSIEGPEVDVRVVFSERPAWVPLEDARPPQNPDDPPALEIGAGSGHFILRYADGTTFYFDLGKSTIWATWPDGLTLEDTARYLLGPVLGFYLRLRGHVCLHASAVILQDRCVAFLGFAGAGKSTLAAAFATQGQAVLTEDVACLDESGDSFSVRPGYPLVRLWDDAAKLLPVAAGTLPLLTPNWSKRYLPLGGTYRFYAEPAPLAAVFVLQERRVMTAAAEAQDMAGQDVLIQLVVNTYGTRLLDRSMRAHEFQMLGRLTKAVPVRSLALNADGSRLGEACAWIERHAFA
jgi:hypothetical protein